MTLKFLTLLFLSSCLIGEKTTNIMIRGHADLAGPVIMDNGAPSGLLA